MLIRLILSILVLLVLLWIIINFRANKNPQPSSAEILKERMKKGEITKKEYEEALLKQGKKPE